MGFKMLKKVLVLGATGMLGSTLWRRLPKFGYEVWGTVRGAGSERLVGDVDATNLLSIERAINEIRPEVVINCVGVIRQRQDGQDPVACISLNALFPHQLAALTKRAGTRLIHVSTDCVFSGKTEKPYLESDFADAKDIYGRTKYLGEVSDPGCITLRTSIIGHEQRGKLSLLEWFLSQTGPVKGYTEAIYSGLPTTELMRVIGEFVIPNERLTGLYQVSSDPISKYDLLLKINAIYHKGLSISSDNKVRENKSLDSTRFRKETGWFPPTWDQMIRDMHADFQPQNQLQRDLS